MPRRGSEATRRSTYNVEGGVNVSVAVQVNVLRQRRRQPQRLREVPAGDLRNPAFLPGSSSPSSPSSPRSARDGAPRDPTRGERRPVAGHELVERTPAARARAHRELSAEIATFGGFGSVITRPGSSLRVVAGHQP